jgi:hypothetical protein
MNTLMVDTSYLSHLNLLDHHLGSPVREGCVGTGFDLDVGGNFVGKGFRESDRGYWAESAHIMK